MDRRGFLKPLVTRLISWKASVALLGSGGVLILLWQVLPTYDAYVLAELFGAFGVVLIISGLITVTISLAFGPLIRRSFQSWEQSSHKWGKNQNLALVIIFLILAFGFNTLSGHVGRASDNYDEQIGMTFSADVTRMDVNVTAVEQSGSSGSGPAYLLNGFSNASYWYQVGLLSNWSGPRLGCDAAFEAGYAVFAPDGTEIFPSQNSLNGAVVSKIRVHQRDIVGLSLYFSGGNVMMRVHDWNTGEQSAQSYPGFGATYFRGMQKQWSGPNGFFTGLMTEQYYPNYYYGGEQRVHYTWSQNLTRTSAWMWISEFVPPPTHNQTIFFQPIYLNYNLTKGFSYAFNGAFVSSLQYEFTTGQLDPDGPQPRWVCAILNAV